jgi:hypothetical protein
LRLCCFVDGMFAVCEWGYGTEVIGNLMRDTKTLNSFSYRLRRSVRLQIEDYELPEARKSVTVVLITLKNRLFYL